MKSDEMTSNRARIEELKQETARLGAQLCHKERKAFAALEDNDFHEAQRLYRVMCKHADQCLKNFEEIWVRTVRGCAPR